MSDIIDNKIVEMQFNNKQFEEGVKTSLSTIDRLKQSLKFDGIQKGFDNITGAAKSCDFSGMQNAIETVHAKFSAFEVMAVTALANITNSAINAGKNLIASLSVDQISEGWQKFSDKTVSVGTLISQGYELDEVNEQLSRLNWFTDETSYNFTDMVSNIAKFTATGKKLDESVTAMEGIANWAALSGQNAQTASRAMYQISQAMGAGSMRLEDYRSIQNASMDTDEFRQKCLDAAVALGTLRKNADDTYTSLNNESISFSKAGFASSLTEGAWLTSDVMMQVFNNYSAAVDQIYEYAEEKGITASEAIEELGGNVDQFGLKAFKAAQEARTFGDVLDSVKDAVSTGWMNTFEIIFGNYEEAKTLWTDLANAMWDVFAGGAEARNEMLQEWKDLGGRDDLIESFWNLWDAIDKVVTPIKEAFRDIFPATTAEQLKSITEKVKDFTENLKINEETAEKIKDIFKGVFSVFDMLKKTVGAVAKSFSPLISRLGEVGGGIFDAAANFGNFLSGLNESADKMGVFEEITKRLSSAIQVLSDFIFDFVDNTIVSFIEGGEGLSGVFEVVFDTLANVTRAIFDVVSALTGKDFSQIRDKVVSVIQTVRNTVVDAISNFKEFGEKVKEYLNLPDFDTIKSNVSDFISSVKENFQTPGFELFHNILERIQERMSQLGDFLGKVKSSASTAIQTIADTIIGSNLLETIEKIWKVVKTVVGGVIKGIGSLIKAVTNGLGDVDFSKTFDFFNSVSLGAIAAGIVTFVKGFKDTVKDISSIKESFVGVLDGVKDCLSAFTMEIKADALMRIAGALAILAASILVISLINSDKLTGSLEALTVMFIDLVAALAAVDKLVQDERGVKKSATALLVMSAAVLVLSSALKKISDIDTEHLISSLVAITVLLAELVVVSKTMETDSKGMIKAATAMVIFGAAVNVLATACEKFADMDWEEIAKGLVGVGGLLAEIDIFLNTTKFSKGAVSSGMGILLIAEAIKVLASACEKFAEMNIEELIKGLTSVGIILAEIMGFTYLSGKSENILSTGISLIAIAAAMKIFASAMSDFGSLSWEDIAKGFLSIASSLLAIVAAVNLMPKNMLSIGTGLILVGTSLELIANVMKKIGNLSWEAIGKGLLTIGFALGELSIALNLMKGAVSGAAALAIAAASLLLLTPVLSILGAMSWEAIVKGLVSLAGAFTVIGVAGALLSPIMPSILGLGAALALIGVGVLALGTGLVAAGAGLSAIGVGVTALSASLTAVGAAIVAAIGVIVLGILDLAPQIIDSLTDIVVALCGAISNTVPALGEAIKAVILTLMDVIIECAPDIAEGLLTLLDSALSALSKHIGPICDSLFKIVIEILNSISEHAPEFIGAVVGVFKSIFDGVAALFDGDGAADLLESIAKIGNALGSIFGSFIGGIAGGIMDGIVSQFPEMGQNLADFMVNAKPFFDGLKKIDAQMIEGIGALSKIILSLTAAELLNGLTSWFKGSNSLSKFGKELAEFGPYLVDYSDAIKGLDSSAVKNSAEAGKALAEMAKAFPNEGGVLGWFMGENNASVFGENMAKFGPKLMEYAKSVEGLDAKSVLNSVEPAKALAEMAKAFPNDGGVVGFFTGENDATSFGKNIAAFGKKLKEYSDNVKDLNYRGIVNSVEPAKALAEMAKAFPNDGGVFGWFVGENGAADFGKSIAEFGKYFAKYGKSISDLNLNAVSSSAKSASALADVLAKLPADKLLKNETWLNDFGKDLSEFGGYFSKYGDEISNIDVPKLSAVDIEVEKLVSIVKGMTEIDSNKAKDFGKNLANIGKDGISDFIKAFTDSVSKVTKAAEDIIEAFIKGIDNNKTKISNSGGKIIESLLDKIDSNKNKFTSSAQELIIKFSSGLESKTNLITSTITKMIRLAISTIKNKYNSFSDAGIYVIKGFANGMSSQTSLVKQKAQSIASAALIAMTDELDINSPSKETYEIGENTGNGFINALTSYVGKAYDAGIDVAANAKEGLAKAVQRVYDLVDGKVDIQPVIKPVLDLSNVTDRVSSINNMFASDRAISLAGSANTYFSKLQDKNQNGVIVNNNDVIKELSGLRSDLSSIFGIIGKIKIVLDSGTMVGSLLNQIDAALGTKTIRKGRRN